MLILCPYDSQNRRNKMLSCWLRTCRFLSLCSLRLETTAYSEHIFNCFTQSKQTKTLRLWSKYWVKRSDICLTTELTGELSYQSKDKKNPTVPLQKRRRNPAYLYSRKPSQSVRLLCLKEREQELKYSLMSMLKWGVWFDRRWQDCSSISVISPVTFMFSSYFL